MVATRAILSKLAILAVLPALVHSEKNPDVPDTGYVYWKESSDCTGEVVNVLGLFTDICDTVPEDAKSAQANLVDGCKFYLFKSEDDCSAGYQKLWKSKQLEEGHEGVVGIWGPGSMCANVEDKDYTWAVYCPPAVAEVEPREQPECVEGAIHSRHTPWDAHSPRNAILQCPNLDWVAWQNSCYYLMTQFDALSTAFKAKVLQLYAYVPVSKEALVARMVDTVMYSQTTNPSSREDYIKLNFIMKTNCFIVDGFCGLWLDLARANHSCCSNGIAHSEPNSAVKYIRARRDIKKGEEITIEYMLPTTSNRAAVMRENWGFECKCPVCNTNDPSMDKATRDKYEEMFAQARENDKALFEGQPSTSAQKLRRHKLRLEAEEFLGPSVALCNELGDGIRLVLGNQQKMREGAAALYKMICICDGPEDVNAATLKKNFGL
ncbi:Uu.00g125730.m01.CDS01 [Anthostomella pinea]|uniref:Uu.00g125730.m01.CDS01 n=1 Tax=Anthostomella pinea TaxID=933095 RepID=A0AAI8VHR0_9PEZI|nr:Uu.00g125730.m01.CDS01 [Anthostomella pinea]